jgi:hypothetical protein
MAGSDSNADFFRREHVASLKRYVRARREPREFSHATRQQTERCNRVCRFRLRRRHRARRVLGFPSRTGLWRPVVQPPGVFMGTSCHAPRRRGIQYAAASNMNAGAFWNTESPGHRRAEATPSFGRLCRATTSSKRRHPQKFEQLDPVMPPTVKSLHINPGLSGSG